MSSFSEGQEREQIKKPPGKGRFIFQPFALPNAYEVS
jgi:hypothetical protein